MARNDLINRLVARKMATDASARAACIPCTASPARKHCWAPPKKYCLPAANPKK
jgi:hypothetical protein